MAHPGLQAVVEHAVVLLPGRLAAAQRRRAGLRDVAVGGECDPLGAGRVATRLPALAVQPDQPRELLEVADVGHEHQVVAHLAGPLERLGRADRRDPDGGVRLLLRPWVNSYVLPAVEAPLKRDVLLGPQAHAGGDALLVARTAVFGGHAEG